MASAEPPLAQIVVRATQEPGFRGRILWFPDEVADEYGASDAERAVLRTGDLTGVELPAERLAQARWVFDTHDMFSGE